MRKPHPESLENLRGRIDAVDSELLAVLGKRQALVGQVVMVKERDRLPARIPERVAEVVERVMREAPQHGASPELARAVWTAMIEWFIAFEERALRR